MKTEAKEREILEAASRIFSRRDFHEVLIDDVALAAGIGKGTIYRYFRTKDELYLAAVASGFVALNRRLEEALPSEGSPSRRLERLTSESLRFFWAQRQVIPLLYRVESRFRSQQGAIGKEREHLIGLISATLAEGIACKEFRPFDSRIGAELLFGMIRAANLYRREGDRIETLVSELLGVFTRGVARTSSSPSRPRLALASPMKSRRRALRA